MTLSAFIPVAVQRMVTSIATVKRVTNRRVSAFQREFGRTATSPEIDQPSLKLTEHAKRLLDEAFSDSERKGPLAFKYKPRMELRGLREFVRLWSERLDQSWRLLDPRLSFFLRCLVVVRRGA